MCRGRFFGAYLLFNLDAVRAELPLRAQSQHGRWQDFILYLLCGEQFLEPSKVCSFLP